MTFDLANAASGSRNADKLLGFVERKRKPRALVAYRHFVTYSSRKKHADATDSLEGQWLTHARK